MWEGLLLCTLKNSIPPLIPSPYLFFSFLTKCKGFPLPLYLWSPSQSSFVTSQWFLHIYVPASISFYYSSHISFPSSVPSSFLSSSCSTLSIRFFFCSYLISVPSFLPLYILDSISSSSLYIFHFVTSIPFLFLPISSCCKHSL